MTVDTEKFRTILIDRRARVEHSIERLHHDASPEDELDEAQSDNHPGDVATETYERELDEGLEEASEQTLEEIDAALARIDDGTYGRCLECGKEILEERLEAIPWTRYCVEDQRRLEGR